MKEWIKGRCPNIPKGEKKSYLVTLEGRKTGNRFVCELDYMNGHLMPLSDDHYDAPDCAKPHNPEPDGHCEEYEWYGWFTPYCEVCECSWYFHDHHMKIVAYMELPEPFKG